MPRCARTEMVRPLVSVILVMVDVIAGRMRWVRQSRAQLLVFCVAFSAVAGRCSSIAVLCTLCIPNSFLNGTSGSIRMESAFECTAVYVAS